MLRGFFKILNRDTDTKAFSASSTLFGSTDTYTPRVMRVTWVAVGVGVRVESTGPRGLGWPGGRAAPEGGPHQEGGADPDEDRYSIKVGSLAQQPELVLSDALHLLQEAGFPGIQFQQLDATQDLAHQLDAGVLELHLLYLRKD